MSETRALRLTDQSRFGRAVLQIALRVAMPLTDLPVAIFAFVVTVVGLALAIGLMPLFLVGLPLFVGVGAAVWFLAGVQRARMHLYLGIEIPRPPRLTPGIRGAWKDRPTWRAIAYHCVQLPLAAVTFSIAVAGLGASLALISMPAWIGLIPARRASLWLLTVSDQPTAWAMVGLGVIVGVIGVAATYALTTAEGALARALLGVSAAELAHQVDELRSSRARVVDSVEAERRRIERDLHDGAQQRLVALAMNLGRARARYDADPEAARVLLDEAHADAKQALIELRDLARGLHPAVLTDRGLDAALSGIAGISPVPVTLDVDVAPRCDPTIEGIAYFVVSEALTNVAKHSGASRAHVVARRERDRLVVTVTDDGKGGAVVRAGGGLAGLADRVGGVDGSLTVESPIGGPTVLTVELPCAS